MNYNEKSQYKYHKNISRLIFFDKNIENNRGNTVIHKHYVMQKMNFPFTNDFFIYELTVQDN